MPFSGRSRCADRPLVVDDMPAGEGGTDGSNVESMKRFHSIAKRVSTGLNESQSGNYRMQADVGKKLIEFAVEYSPIPLHQEGE